MFHHDAFLASKGRGQIKTKPTEKKQNKQKVSVSLGHITDPKPGVFGLDCCPIIWKHRTKFIHVDPEKAFKSSHFDKWWTI